jgi:hypothetical protein
MDTLQIEKVSPDLSFPLRLYILMRDAEDEFPSIISWEPSSNGTIFQVHDADELEKKVLPKYFRSSIKFSSFRRQLLGYGFQCVGKLQCESEIRIYRVQTVTNTRLILYAFSLFYIP